MISASLTFSVLVCPLQHCSIRLIFLRIFSFVLVRTCYFTAFHLFPCFSIASINLSSSSSAQKLEFSGRRLRSFNSNKPFVPRCSRILYLRIDACYLSLTICFMRKSLHWLAFLVPTNFAILSQSNSCFFHALNQRFFSSLDQSLASGIMKSSIMIESSSDSSTSGDPRP